VSVTARTTDQFEGLLAETVLLSGADGQEVHAYFAKPLTPGPHPGIVLFHHFPGWDEWYKEQTRRFAHHGYLAICPDLFCRFGHGAVDDVAALARTAGGPPDDDVVGDAQAAADFLRAQETSNRKVGAWGTCSGGRHAFLVACRTDRFDAAADLWGGGVVATKEEATTSRPVAPIEYTEALSCPLLGLFGNDDSNPTPDQVNTLEEALRRQGKEYEFHRYDGAGHGFFYYDRPAAYRAEEAVDGWQKIWTFYSRTLGGT
jgi:carboxymethylenebutenolidase